VLIATIGVSRLATELERVLVVDIVAAPAAVVTL